MPVAFTMRKLIPILLLAALGCSAEDRKTTVGEAGNDAVDIYATPLIDKDAIKDALGAELPEGIIAVKVRVVPKGEDPLSISRDDFEIISHRDGQRSGPFVPSQIAGSATMVIRTTNGGGGLYSGNPNGPVWGGIPGVGGRPRQMGGDGGAMGNGASAETETKATQTDDVKAKNNPLLAILQDKMFLDKETKEPVSGLLYFPLDGKVKLKDLELIYKGPAGRLIVPFTPVK